MNNLLVIECPKCGAANQAGTDFCGLCLTAFSMRPTPVETDIDRRVTQAAIDRVLVDPKKTADVAGATRLGALAGAVVSAGVTGWYYTFSPKWGGYGVAELTLLPFLLFILLQALLWVPLASVNCFLSPRTTFIKATWQGLSLLSLLSLMQLGLDRFLPVLSYLAMTVMNLLPLLAPAFFAFTASMGYRIGKVRGQATGKTANNQLAKAGTAGQIAGYTIVGLVLAIALMFGAFSPANRPLAIFLLMMVPVVVGASVWYHIAAAEEAYVPEAREEAEPQPAGQPVDLDGRKAKPPSDRQPPVYVGQPYADRPKIGPVLQKLRDISRRRSGREELLFLAIVIGFCLALVVLGLVIRRLNATSPAAPEQALKKAWETPLHVDDGRTLVAGNRIFVFGRRQISVLAANDGKVIRNELLPAGTRVVIDETNGPYQKTTVTRLLRLVER